MNGRLLFDILVVVIPLTIGFITYLQAQKAIRTQARSQLKTAEIEVDAEAYDRAKGLYESSLADLERHVGRLRDQINLLVTEIAKLQASNAELSQANVQLQASYADLNKSNIQLQASNAELRHQVEDLQAVNTRLEREVKMLRESNENP